MKMCVTLNLSQLMKKKQKTQSNEWEQEQQHKQYAP